MTTATLNSDCCPICGSSWDGGSIFDAFAAARDAGKPSFKGLSDEQLRNHISQFYSEPHRWSRVISFQIRGNYDRPSFIECPDCHSRWDYLTGKEILKNHEQSV